MDRTQIYLSPKQLRSLKRRAFKENTSISSVIRALIDEELKTGEVGKDITTTKNPGSWLLDLSKEASNLKIRGPKDLASGLDKYLYGKG